MIEDEEIDEVEANDDPDLEPVNFDHSLYIAEYLISCRNTPLDILRMTRTDKISMFDCCLADNNPYP